MIKVVIHTGRQSFNEKLIARLTPALSSMGVELVDFDKGVDVAVCLPEAISLFNNQLLLVLTDDVHIPQENDNVLEITPIPISDDDFARLEWKLIKIIDSLLDDV